MSTGVWEPNKKLEVDAARLRGLLAVCRAAGPDLAASLPPGFVQDNAMLMKQEEGDFAAAGELTDEEVIDLIRFFTVAEMQLPGWEGGKTNPVIYLVKILKHRDGFSAELRKWIKANTDNRWLPHGSAL